MTKLEQIFLMSVALKLPNYRDLFNFININKKALMVVQNLKTNPFFCSEGVLSFLLRFTPDTINMDGVYSVLDESFIKAKWLKNCIFVDSDPQEVIKTFSKTLSLILVIDERLEKETNFIIEHATEFTNLKKIQGDLSLVINFFKEYTANGTEMNINFPSFIFVYEYNDEKMEVNPTTVDAIEELLKYVRVNDETKIICVFKKHSANIDLLKRLRKVRYYHQCFVQQGCELMNENYFLDGNLQISYFNHEDSINGIIEKCYPETLFFSEGDKDKSIDLSNREKWDIPSCISTVTVDGFSHKPTLKQIPFCINLSHIKTLSFENCNSFNLSVDLKVTDFISLDGITGSQFTFNFEKPINIEQIVLRSCDSVQIQINNSPFSDIELIACTNSIVNGNFNELKEFFARECDECTIPYFEFENKKVTIEKCFGMKFLDDSNCAKSPLEYCGIDTSDMKELMEQFICLPEIPISYLQKGYFIMRRFYYSLLAPKITDSVMIRKDALDDIHLYWSEDFFDEEEKIKDMEIIKGGQKVVVKALVRYFELAVKGYSFISLGLVDKNNYDFETEGGHIGWGKGSVGYHSDDGLLYLNGGIGRPYGKPYGLSNNGEHVVGCGYDTIAEEVFFTLDGKLLGKVLLGWQNVVAAVAVSEFERIEINYGQHEFKFDLLNMEKEVEKNVKLINY